MRQRPLIVDANVLIDYVESKPRVLALVARVISPLRIARPLLREVEQLDERRCEELGLEVTDPSLEQLLEAASRGGPLSFEDWLCLILARDHGLTNWTMGAPVEETTIINRCKNGVYTRA